MKLRDYIRTLLPGFTSSALMAVAVVLWRHALADASWTLRLSTSVILGILVYSVPVFSISRDRVKTALALIRGSK
jgi:hypothetical protein